ncbi:MAG: UvrD-helicase domain-containing protein [Deltaproteobacteria bacterium]|nr:UvrD-helicase domain-containing protein [Deltaproteobacteria bacterium]
MVDLSKLNPPQREAASHGGGPLLVLAGAGSGKTRVITFRIAHLLDQGIPARAICAVTFTNKAAEEMRERIAALLGNKKLASELTIGTFHALGLQILRTERKALGMPRGFAIYDQADQLGVVREAMRSIRDGDRRYDAKAVQTRISLAKNAFIAPDEFEGNPADDYDQITRHVFPKYQEALRAFGAFDFDDLIVEPVRLWDRDADARTRWADRFHYVMVDEFQDTNKAQLRMVQALVGKTNNLMVVGDDDQSIYSWRGADPTNILEFDRVFPGAKIVKLEQNYRSTKRILEAANTVIANNKNRHGKTLWSQHGDGEIITHAVAATAEAEAKWVAQEIRRLQAEGRRFSDIAVLYRSNIQSKIIEEELRTHEVPYVMYGGQQFFERKEVKDLIAYLRVALNPKDELALRRVINYPARGIGATTVEKLATAAQAAHTTMWDALVAADVGGAAKHGIAQFMQTIEQVKTALEAGHDIVATVKQLIADIALYDDLRHAAASMSAAQRRIDNVEGLLGSLKRFSEKGKGVDALGEYLRHLSLDSKDEKEDASGDKVILTTLHGAKGLEFPVCFMIGLEEELLPHARTLQPQATDVTDADHATDISEERRLCYVGITRAQRKLYLTRAITRVSRGRVIPRTPSRFLLEVPDELLEIRDLGEEARQRVPQDEVRSFFANFSFDE